LSGTGGTVEADDGVANARVFKYTELSEASDSFDPSRVIGKGRLGCVYRGILKSGQEVAVKRFDVQADMSAEVHILTCVDHPNLIKMIGYCDEGKEHFIVYEFMPLQSLSLHLQDLEPGKTPLDWKTRMKIAEGVAKALEYLHNQKDPPVIYGGLNSTDILLDEKYNPKLSDFSCVNHVDTPGHCTMGMKLPDGYIPVEYRMTGRILLESDIYSFAAVLLELISGRKAVDPSRTLRKAHLVRR
ncbi:hypothetical protein MKW94_020728, partial [Papaver nudicaule]|nr:hypothetical protein [Papaver nudicaule]